MACIRIEQLAEQVNEMRQQMTTLLAAMAAQKPPNEPTSTTPRKPVANRRKRPLDSCSSSPENQYVKIAKGFMGARGYKWYGGADRDMCAVCKLTTQEAYSLACCEQAVSICEGCASTAMIAIRKMFTTSKRRRLDIVCCYCSASSTALIAESTMPPPRQRLCVLFAKTVLNS
jgi:hypothetical protein